MLFFKIFMKNILGVISENVLFFKINWWILWKRRCFFVQLDNLLYFCILQNLGLTEMEHELEGN